MDREMEYCIYFTFMTIILSYFICVDSCRKFIPIINVLSVLFSSISILIFISITLDNNKLINVLGLVLVGFLLKLADTLKILDASIIGSGTGWFHIITGIGLPYIWKQLQ